MITRFSVPNLNEVTIHLTNVVNGKSKPDQILTNAKILSTYTDTILENKEVWISKGRIACIKNVNDHKIFNPLFGVNVHLNERNSSSNPGTSPRHDLVRLPLKNK